MSRILLALVFLSQSLNSLELVDRVTDKYGRLNSLSADFEQISQDSSNRKGHLRGHVFLKKGRKALFQYDSPQQFEYFDGTNYTLYRPSIQATRCPISKALDDRLVIFMILGNPGSPWREHFPTMVEMPKESPSTRNRIVKLIPEKKDIPEVTVEVDPASFLIQRFVSSRVDGARDEFRFTNITTAPLPDSLFNFNVKGVEIVESKVC